MTDKEVQYFVEVNQEDLLAKWLKAMVKNWRLWHK